MDGVEGIVSKAYQVLLYFVKYVLFIPLWTLNGALSLMNYDEKGRIRAALQGVSVVLLIFGSFWFTFGETYDDIIPVGSDFGLNAVLARSLILIGSVLLVILFVSLALVFACGKKGNTLVEGLDFKEKYQDYLAGFVHSTTTLIIIASALLWQQHVEDGSWEGVVVTQLILIIVGAYTLKLNTELAHGLHSEKNEEIALGAKRSLLEEYKQKHARGPVVFMGIGLLLYALVNGPTDETWYDLLWNNIAFVLLLAYILVVSLERVAVGKDEEWVLGKAGKDATGIVMTGGVMQVLIFYTGMYVGSSLTQESVFFAIGIAVLDTMRAGYGASYLKNVIEDREAPAIVYRLFNVVWGIIAFALISMNGSELFTEETIEHFDNSTNVTTVTITKTPIEGGTGSTTTDLLFGISLAFALLKITSGLYLGKDLLKNGTENFFRQISSTGLLLTSIVLWSWPIANENNGWPIFFFVTSLIGRLLDSYIDTLLRGKEFGDWVYTLTKDEEGVDKPSYDNPRSWIVLTGLLASLFFLASVHIDAKVGDLKPGDVRFDAMGVAIALVVVHLAVVVLALGLSGVRPDLDEKNPWKWFGLSRLNSVRFVVSTIVLLSITVAAGTMDFKSEFRSNSNQFRIAGALLSYLAVDTVGRELL